MLWFVAFALGLGVMLHLSNIGNWIYATGDNKESARANGVPVNRVKIGLFMFTAFCATMFAACQVFDTNTSDAAKGNLMELFAIAIAVVGSTVLVVGIIMIVTPGPAIVVIPVGLAILGMEFAWARIWLRKVRQGISRNSANHRASRVDRYRRHDRH